ncbi:alpha/beta fold hydrolase [Chitinophaga defluvii]|uniref:Alpha/beta hydrolase n=1 Tax=Chitinophaga defluvii TaxID=3163343 RepID=A0ABV2TB32_9BACT
MNTIIKTMCSCLMLLLSITTSAQKVSYGNNPEAGHYINVGDAKLYYEVYGKGEPIVLLHGGVFGYIDEFENLIPKLADKYQVICIATRGHGKSEIGHSPFTYKQRAEDAYKVIRSITQDSVTVIGFSDGGFSGLKLAALYPNLVKKLVAMGVTDRSRAVVESSFNYSAAGLVRDDPDFLTKRLQLMPDAERWNECQAKLTKLYNTDYMSTETFRKIKCPVLIVSGDKDTRNPMEGVMKCAQAIPDHQLSIIPDAGHTVLNDNFPLVWETVAPFLNK